MEAVVEPEHSLDVADVTNVHKTGAEEVVDVVRER